MRLAACAGFAGLLLLGLVACAGREWTEFRMPGGDFAVSAPTKPALAKDETEKDGGIWRIYQVDQGSVAYTIDYSVSAPAKKAGAKAGSLDARLDVVRDAVVREMKAKLRNERRFTMGESRATELIFDIPATKEEAAYTIKARFYLRRDQTGRDLWYKTMVVGPAGYDANPNVARFLDSFHFVTG
jgi:hypothetical protein